MGLNPLVMTYLGARCLFRYNYYESFTLINFEYNRPFGSYSIVSVVYYLFWSTRTFLKNSILCFASPRRELLEGLNESLVTFPGVVKLEECSVWFLCSERIGDTPFSF